MRKTELVYLFVAVILLGISVLNLVKVPEKLNIVNVHPKTSTDIIPVAIPNVKPVLYDSLLIDVFASTQQRKQQFIDQVLPAILLAQYDIAHKSKKVDHLIKKMEKNVQLSANEIAFADSLMELYRAKSYENLLVRLKPHPTSLVLAQAIIESGWGMSRFATEGNNLFGVWTVSGDKNTQKSMFDRGEQKIFVKKYPSIAESVNHYYLTIGRHNAYRNFRQKRYHTDDVFELIGLLDKYSENGEAYTTMLKKIIEWNDLTRYDECVIDSDYISHNTLLEIYFEKIQKILSSYLKNKKVFQNETNA
ncbi:MAG: glucosaminidase domain-containing protein [Prolixibacteraceae bacterium]|nr:glucosaminidase domain-containing protein [Prolixibacteraceae bacterium]